MELTTKQREEMADRLAQVRAQLLANGATALNPTPEWAALRKELSTLAKSLKSA